jgi:hypothetical protein
MAESNLTHNPYSEEIRIKPVQCKNAMPEEAQHMLNCVHGAPKVNSPLMILFEKLLKPELVKYPSWFKELKLHSGNIKIFIVNEAEDELLILFLDLTHRSYLQFLNYLLHERLLEYARLKQICQFPICPIIVTLGAVQNAIQHFLPIFEYTNISQMEASFKQAAHMRRTMRLKSPTLEIIHQNVSLYNWAQKDKHDVDAFQQFLTIMFNIPVYTYHTLAVSVLTPSMMSELRTKMLSLITLPENTYTPVAYQGININTTPPISFSQLIPDHESRQVNPFDDQSQISMPVLEPEVVMSTLSNLTGLNTLATVCEQQTDSGSGKTDIVASSSNECPTITAALENNVKLTNPFEN